MQPMMGVISPMERITMRTNFSGVSVPFFSSSPPMGSTARGAQGRKTARESYFTVDSRKIIRNGVAAARISRQNISIHPHRSASATVDGTTFPVSMDTAVTARVTGK